MSAETMSATLDFIGQIAAETQQAKVKVTFHGGEPLAAGHALWQQALEGFSQRFGPGNCEVAVQSNLWLFDDAFCDLFRHYKVEIGTSLDGPEDLTDRQRGNGYFSKTMAGIHKAHSAGMNVGCIATFTTQNLQHWREVFDFFLSRRMGFSIHAAVPPLEDRHLPGALTPGQYADLLRQMLDYYIENRRELAVSSLDQICQGMVAGEGKVCTFRDCLGMFLAIDPEGGIYPCQRFCGRPEYRLATLAEQPGMERLFSGPVAQEFYRRETQVRESCKDCAHSDYCKGGCTYNAWASTNRNGGVDPYCAAYRGIFDYIQDRLTSEMASDENIAAIADRPFTGNGNPLLRKGPLIEIARVGPHPSRVARTAKRIVAAVELAKEPDISTVAERLVRMGISRSRETAEASLDAFRHRLHPTTTKLNNLYLHVTFACQLNCTHCYARADAHGRSQPEMPVSAVQHLVKDAKQAGFRQVVITGGEPLVHTNRDGLLTMLAEGRPWSAPMNLVLRTNLAMELADEDLLRVGAAFDQVVVSVDGTEQTHDARRGTGAYAAMVHNLERYAELESCRQGLGELSLATVMRSDDIQGEPGFAVRELAHRLGVKRTRFRPLLPLGRARDWDEPPTSEALGAYADPMELIENGFYPVASCGLGQNLYVEPSGESFPCYAYHQPHSYLGNVIKAGLASVLASPGFIDLARHCVDTNTKCRKCEVRYLCGGACRAWGGETAQHDLDAPPPECEGLKKRAAGLLMAAHKYLGTRIPSKEDNHA